MSSQEVAALVAEVAARVEAQVTARMMALFPTRPEMQNLRDETKATSLEQALIALNGNGRLVVNGGQLFLDLGEGGGGDGSGFEVRGEERLYYGPVLRAYDSGGNLVDVGSEGDDSALFPTWDEIGRAHV